MMIKSDSIGLQNISKNLSVEICPKPGPSDFGRGSVYLAVVYQGMVSLGDGQALSVLVGNSSIWAE